MFLHFLETSIEYLINASEKEKNKIMKNLRFIILIFSLCISCKHRLDEKKYKTGLDNISLSKSSDSTREPQDSTANDLLNKSKVVGVNLDIVKKDSIPNQFFLTSFSDIFPSITINDIKKIMYVKEANLRNWGMTSIYKFELSDQLPESVYKKGILVISKLRAQAAIFFLDNFDLVKLKEADTAYFLAGVHILKSRGYFYLYEFDGTQYFLSKFSTLSDNYCNNGIPVYNNSLECICYKPFELIFKNIDVDKDGLMDLNFSGDILSFCEGLQNGYGREDRKPTSVFKLNITFIASQKNNEITWMLLDTSFCSKLNK